MTNQDIEILEEFFTCRAKEPYTGFPFYSKEKQQMAQYCYHNECDYFKLIIFEDNTVYQLNSEYDTMGIEMETLEDFKIRFKSFTGQEYDETELSYEERVKLYDKKRISKAKAEGLKFVSPGVYTTERGPSYDLLDAEGIPKYKKTVYR